MRGGKARTANSGISELTQGYDPDLRVEMGEYDPFRAKALLDLYGFVDGGGDGWRERPDGSALRLRQATQPDEFSRQYDELMKRDMGAVGIRTDFDAAQWPEQLKASRAGTLMMWRLGWGSGPDVLGWLVQPARPGSRCPYRLPRLRRLDFLGPTNRSLLTAWHTSMCLVRYPKHR